jgi:O-methyltransferase
MVKYLLKKFHQPLEELQRLLQEQITRNAALEVRVGYLEQRLLSYYKNRWDVIDKLADYLVGAEIGGNYLEFGVFEGRTFGYAYKIMAPLFSDMRFVAFDSFQGLPEPSGIDADGAYSSSFIKGQFQCDKDRFLQNLMKDNPLIDLSRVRTVEGWFNESLCEDNLALTDLKTVSAAWIDCDLYESTVPVLDFLTHRLKVGSVILFDDWRCFRNLENYGEQKACKEWLMRNPQIRLNPFIDFGFHGISFTVSAC